MKRTLCLSFLTLALLLSFGALLLLYPQEAASAAREGLRLCFELIIPSLFPFFVLSSLLVSLGFAALLGRCLRGVLWPMFRLGPACGTALVLGAVGGYPVGARVTAQLCESGACSKGDALRLSVFCNNCGPAFLFSVAGWGVFGSREVGFLLLGTHLAAALLLGLLLRFLPLGKAHAEPSSLPPTTRKSFSAAFPDCVRDSFSSTLNVCAFVILFSVILRLLHASGILPLLSAQLSEAFPLLSPALSQSLLGGFFELSSGVSSLQAQSADPAALPLAAFLLGWGGLAVHCQSLPFWKACLPSLRPYFIGKFLQGILAALLVALLTPYLLPVATPAMLPAAAPVLPLVYQALFRAEILALFSLSGIYFLFSRQKGLSKWKAVQYNKK